MEAPLELRRSLEVGFRSRQPRPRSEIPYRAYLDWRANLGTFEELAVIGSTNWTLRLRLRDGLMAIPHRSVSANFFRVVAAPPFSDERSRRPTTGVAPRAR